ncbi:MAG: multicopper oxidase domain-containing protein [Actinomycetota bacterium]
MGQTAITRRALFGAAAGAGGLAVLAGGARLAGAGSPHGGPPDHGAGHDVAHAGTRGAVDHRRNGFDPHEILTDWDRGRTRRLPGGRVLREWEVVAEEKEIEVAPGVYYPAWTYNGRVPGPTFRATQGDLLRIRFRNGTAHPHTMHFHGLHRSVADGSVGTGPGGGVAPGGEHVYEFTAAPFGLHLYHCHTFPLAAHIAKGLYGAFVIDPPGGRPDAHEIVLVQNGFDTNFDKSNEVYAVNTVAFAYMDRPIPVRRGEPLRVYLVNVLEYDLLNSFHLHGNFFHHYPTGTSLEPSELTDTVAQVQGQRGILEMTFPDTGTYMFHAHQSEFAELGWTGLFQVS